MSDRWSHDTDIWWANHVKDNLRHLAINTKRIQKQHGCLHFVVIFAKVKGFFCKNYKLRCNYSEKCVIVYQWFFHCQERNKLKGVLIRKYLFTCEYLWPYFWSEAVLYCTVRRGAWPQSSTERVPRGPRAPLLSRFLAGGGRSREREWFDLDTWRGSRLVGMRDLDAPSSPQRNW